MNCNHRPDNSLPLPPFYIVDPGYGVRVPVDPGFGVPGQPVRPSHPIAWERPNGPGVDNTLPGLEGPIDPGYGVDEGAWPDQGLPGVPSYPDNALPGRPPYPTTGPVFPGRRPVDPGFGVGEGRPDNSLPPVIDIDFPVHPDQGLPMPMPQPEGGFTEQEKDQIRLLSAAKFTNTNLPPYRCLVSAARYVLMMRGQTGPSAAPKKV